MASAVLAFYLACLFLGKTTQQLRTDRKFTPSVHKLRYFISANVGDEAFLKCLPEGDFPPHLYWYKQALGETPRHISSFYMYDTVATFHNEFQNNTRFTMDPGKGQNHLKITDLQIADSATYYCISHLYTLDFLASVTLSVKGSGCNVPARVLQSTSESIEPGGSETLNCTVHTGTCGDDDEDGGGEHSVYWFKDSGESHPGIIYTHGGRSDQCVRNSSTQTHTCVYNLPMKSVDVSHAGTYYCAVASCGRILFGDGIKLHSKDEVDSLVLVYFLSGALSFTIILSVFLAFSLYKMNKYIYTDAQSTNQACTTCNAKGHKDADKLYRAAVSVNLTNRKHKDQTWSECVYYSVKQ